MIIAVILMFLAVIFWLYKAESKISELRREVDELRYWANRQNERGTS